MKNIYKIKDKKIIEEYNGTKLISITINGWILEIKENENEKINNITKYITKNIEKIIKSSIDTIDVIKGLGKYPHYDERMSNTFYYDEEEGFVYDQGISGSPDAWNYYLEPIFDTNQLGLLIFNDIMFAKNKKEDIEYDVTINKELENMVI